MRIFATGMLFIYLMTSGLNPEAHPAQVQALFDLRRMESMRDEAREWARKRGQRLSEEEEARWEEAIAPLRWKHRVAKYDYLGLFMWYWAPEKKQ